MKFTSVFGVCSLFAWKKKNNNNNNKTKQQQQQQKKPREILLYYHWFCREMKSEKRAQKFHTGDVAQANLLPGYDQSETIRSV